MGQAVGRARSVCGEPGCPELEPCPEHQATERQDGRANAARRGYGAVWTRYSAAYRKRHPWCRFCAVQQRETPTDAVDHIQPVTGPEDPKFWDPTNHQPLCRSCHAAKTAQEGRTQRNIETKPRIARKWLIA